MTEISLSGKMEQHHKNTMGGSVYLTALQPSTAATSFSSPSYTQQQQQQQPHYSGQYLSAMYPISPAAAPAAGPVMPTSGNVRSEQRVCVRCHTCRVRCRKCNRLKVQQRNIGGGRNSGVARTSGLIMAPPPVQQNRVGTIEAAAANGTAGGGATTTTTTTTNTTSFSSSAVLDESVRATATELSIAAKTKLSGWEEEEASDANRRTIPMGPPGWSHFPVSVLPAEARIISDGDGTASTTASTTTETASEFLEGPGWLQLTPERLGLLHQDTGALLWQVKLAQLLRYGADPEKALFLIDTSPPGKEGTVILCMQTPRYDAIVAAVSEACRRLLVATNASS